VDMSEAGQRVTAIAGAMVGADPEQQKHLIGASYTAHMKIRNWPWCVAMEIHGTPTSHGDIWLTVATHAVGLFNEGETDIVQAVLAGSKEASKLAYRDARVSQADIDGSGSRRWRQTETPVDILDDLFVDPALQVDPMQLTESQVAVEQIVEAVTYDMLPIGEQTAHDVITSYIATGSYAETARDLAVSPDAVWARIRTFRSRMARQPELLEGLFA